MATYNPKYLEEFYTKHIADGSRHADELRACCPAHEDKDPSFSVNLTTGMYHCFSPDCKLHSGGGPVRFLSIIEDMTEHEAQSIIDEEHNNLYPPRAKKKVKQKANFPYTQEDVEERMLELHQNEEKMKFLREKCLWTDQTIESYEIGYNAHDNSYWIPIKENFQLVNIRRYNPQSKSKVISVPDFGEARLYPLENLLHDEIYLMEGEKDCILANQLGLNAVTATAGAGTFITEWKEHFIGKTVIICYDCDSAGRIGSQKVFNTLGHVARSVKVINLPIKVPDTADFTDYILAGNQIQDFHALVQQAEDASAPSDNPVDIDPEVIDTTLDKVADAMLFYKRSRINVRVIAVEASPFIIPRHACIQCNRDAGKKYCSQCRVGDKGGLMEMVIDETTPRILDLIECSTTQKRNIIRDIFHIPQCTRFVIKEKDHQPIHLVAVIPSIDEIKYDTDTYNQTYVERDLYFLGERLDANTDYEIETLAVPSPKDQSLIHLGYIVKPADSSIEEFKMTPGLQDQLGIFQCLLKKN